MNTSKDRILDAAEQIVLRDGVGRLTLEAVAAEAGLSKGGMLYHFRSKDDLIRGMIARLSSLFDSRMERLEAADSNPAGRRTRAYLGASVPHRASEAFQRFDEIATALLAAVSTNRSLLEPLHERARTLQHRLEHDGIDPVLATIVRLAVDGLWLASLFGGPRLDTALQDQVLARLESFTNYESCVVSSAGNSGERR